MSHTVKQSNGVCLHEHLHQVASNQQVSVPAERCFYSGGRWTYIGQVFHTSRAYFTNALGAHQRNLVRNHAKFTQGLMIISCFSVTNVTAAQDHSNM